MKLYPKDIRTKLCDDGMFALAIKIERDEYEMFMENYDADSRYEFEIQKHFPKATENQKAFFYKLLRKLSSHMRLNFEELRMQILIEDGIEVLYHIDGMETVATMNIPKLGKKLPSRMKAGHFYLEQISENDEYKIYRMYKGISQMDTREMTIVTYRLMTRCSDVGLSLITPREYKAMKRKWNQEDR